MEKNTTTVLLPKKGKTSDNHSRKVKAKNEPSDQVISNILNYSKALKVEKRKAGGDVEYIAN